MKKLTLTVIIICSFTGLALGQGQQLTRFAVVDLNKIYMSFFLESRAAREFEEASARVQSDIDKMNREINDLKLEHAEAIVQGDQAKALRLDRDINQKTEFLKEYFTLKTAELEERRRRLLQSDSFVNQIYAQIRYIAESEGYVMVINTKDNPSIVWYSPAIDITDKIIHNLLGRR